MGKRFVVRSRQDWETFLVPETGSDDVRASASRWLASRLEGYVQSTPDAPITLAVPDRFLPVLDDAAEQSAPGVLARRPERRVR